MSDPLLQELVVTALRAWVESGKHLGSHTCSREAVGYVSSARRKEDTVHNEAILSEVAPLGDFRVLRYPFLFDARAAAWRSGSSWSGGATPCHR